MNDFQALILAAAKNKHDETPVHALADYLMEQGDGRGDLLRKSLEYEGPYDFFFQATTNPHRTSHTAYYDSEPHFMRIHTSVGHSRRTDRGDQIVFDVGIDHRDMSEEEGKPNNLRFQTPVTHSEARDIADRLPNSPAFHQWLTNHFGPDPRPKYDHEIDAGLKSSGEGER